MADEYITTAYVDAHIGIGLRQTWFPVATELVTLIEGATGFVQSYLRNSGYSTPSSTTDETVKMAVMGALWQMAASRPATTVKIPEDWKEHPCRKAYVDILNGSVQLTHALNTRSAVGGVAFTAGTVAGSTSGRPAVATHTALLGY